MGVEMYYVTGASMWKCISGGGGGGVGGGGGGGGEGGGGESPTTCLRSSDELTVFSSQSRLCCSERGHWSPGSPTASTDTPTSVSNSRRDAAIAD